MNIGIAGLGLIGGSLAKAIRCNTDNTVWGCDIKDSVVLKAQVMEAIDAELTDELLPQCDVTIVALYPADTMEYIERHKSMFKKGSIVTDCCGVKVSICDPLFDTARQNGFCFVGAHPMAGREFSGFEHSQSSLFDNASMIIVPGADADMEKLHFLKDMFMQIGFSRIQVSTPEEHDKIIACTSQLAHVVSSAYVKSSTAHKYKGFSAGSFADMTRVAKMNEAMWTELFMDNSENLIEEIDELIGRLNAYGAVLRDGDKDGLYALLEEGTRIKKSLE